MEVVAPGDVTAAPFALCPRFQMLAVGMAPTRAAPGEETTGASRVDVLRLLRPSGEPDLGSTLQVDSVLRAPGLRRLAWASTPTQEGESGLTPVEELLYPTGLLAGGFEDGTVRIWNTPISDISKSHVPVKTAPVLMLNEKPEIAKNEKTNISTALSKMYSEMDDIRWTCEGKYCFQTAEENITENWQVVEDDPEWEVISKEEPVTNHYEMTKMELLTELSDLHGPVLGLSFSEVHPYWLASAGLGENIHIQDLHHPFQVLKKKRQLPENGSEIATQITCLKWSRTYPCLLASTSDTGVTKLWDIRARNCMATYTVQGNRTCSSDLEFSVNNPWHLAVSCVNNGRSAAVKIWDLRNFRDPLHQFGSGATGVLSLSWNQCGQLLASHKNGSISCYDPYKKKILEEMDFVHCDLGLTWAHSDDTVATFSSYSGVRLHDIGWALQDGLVTLDASGDGQCPL